MKTVQNHDNGYLKKGATEKHKETQQLRLKYRTFLFPFRLNSVENLK